MEADLDLMRRAITKEFKSGGGQYVFGKAMDFAGWWEEQQAEQQAAKQAKETAAAAVAAAAAGGGAAAAARGEGAEEEEEEDAEDQWLATLLRGDCGSRQDIGVEMSWRTFHNRRIYVKFLHYVKNEWKIDPKDKATILDNSLFVQLTSPTLIAADMVRAILFDKCFRPLRVLCNGVGLQGWHPLKMSAIADRLEKEFEQVLENPELLLEKEYMCFDGCDVLRANQVKWDAEKQTQSIRTELYDSTDPDIIKAREECSGIITAWATGILKSLRRNCSDFLESKLAGDAPRAAGRYAVSQQTDKMKKDAAHCYCNNIKLGESPFAVVDHLYHAYVGNAKIGTVSGVATAQLNGDWCTGKQWHARGSYNDKAGEKIVRKEKRRKLDRDEAGILEELGEEVRDSLVSMVGKQRKHFRTQYDGDESRQRVARRNRRQAVGKKGREKQEVKLMQGAQYMVMERVTTKAELARVLKLKELKSDAAKEGLLKDQLNIRYLGFSSVDKKSWSCAAEKRTGSVKELTETLGVVLEAEAKAKAGEREYLAGRLSVASSELLLSEKLQCLGAEPTVQRTQLDQELKGRQAEQTMSSAEAAFIPRAARAWVGCCLRTWPRPLTDVERELTRGLEFSCDDDKEWKVEGIDYDEDHGWIVYYCPAAAAAAAPSMLSECDYSSISEVLKWAKGVVWVPQRGDTRREYDDNYEKLKVAELKSKCEELGIELTSIPIAGKQTNPIKADIIAALRAKAAASEQ